MSHITKKTKQKNNKHIDSLYHVSNSLVGVKIFGPVNLGDFSDENTKVIETKKIETI